jgi:2-polyprenyl-6-methoxyphenol hydroxylase-like FAD-dependent oxidoreductase
VTIGKPHAEIAGAGFAGLTVGVALAQRGWTVRVHERADEVRAFGAGIWIWENGVRVLAAIGAADEAFHNCPPADEFLNWDSKGRYVHCAKFSTIPNGSAPRLFCVTRQQLLMGIYHAATRVGVEVVTRSEVVGARPEGELETADGRRLRADLVVGADGVNSKVRDSLGLLKRRKRHIDGAIRVLVPHLPGYTDTWPDRTLREWWCGRRRLLYTPCDREVFYLCFTAPVADTEGAEVPLNEKSWTRSFPHLASPIARVGPENRYDVFETTTLHRWSAGRVAIVGDAAHSMVPGLGQGCGTALANALSLAVTVHDARDLETALASWETARRSLTEHTQLWSAIAWPKTRWPQWAVRQFYNLPLWDRWMTSQRMLPAITIPHGTESDAPWLPPDSQRHAAGSPAMSPVC